MNLLFTSNDVVSFLRLVSVLSRIFFAVVFVVWTYSGTTVQATRTAGGARAGSSRGSGASGSRGASSSVYGASSRGESVLISPEKPGGAATGFSSGGGFAGASISGVRTASGFSGSISKARDKISHSMKSIVRPKAKSPKPSIQRPVKPIFNPSYNSYSSKHGTLLLTKFLERIYTLKVKS